MDRKMTPDQMRNVQMELLAYVDQICRENNLRYFAAYGTLLGAIRHKGFIPWDDDIDLYMPRSDFNQFQRIINREKSCYSILTMNNSDDYYHPFAKIYDNRTDLTEQGCHAKYELGVNIDIFLLDSIPDKSKVSMKHYKQCHRLMIVIYYLNKNMFPKESSGKDLIKGLLTWAYAGLIIMFGQKKRTKKRMERIANKYAFDNAALVFPECNFYREMYERSTFEGDKTADFEGMKIRIPNNYEDCLTQCYGDYMQLPPEEERVATHSSVAYWKE